jgi:hypothetical protein
VPFATKATVKSSATGMSQAEIEVALNPSGNPDGFKIDTTTEDMTLVSNQDSTMKLRANRLVSVVGGYSAETYTRFTGHVERIVPDKDGLTATLYCRSFEGKLESLLDENYPDVLSYIANGYIDREWKGFPVYGIPAFDAWPLETSIADICQRAHIDPTSLGLSAVSASPNAGKRAFRAKGTGTTVYGSKLFAARRPSNLSELVYLQRNKNYGNVGVGYKDYLPADDTYLYPAEITDRLYDRVHELADQYGYDFRFNAAGQAILATRNNPYTFSTLSSAGKRDEVLTPAAISGRVYKKTLKINSGSFDGTDDSYTFTHYNALTNPAQLTVSAWVNSDVTTAPSTYRMIYASARTGTWLGTQSGKFTATMIIGGVSKQVVAPTTLTIGQNYHVAMSYNGSTLSLIIDGVVIGSVAATGTVDLGTSGAAHYIGRYNVSATYFWDGMISRLRIWNVGRTATQIQGDMSSDLAGTESGLIACIPFDTVNSAANLVSGGTALTASGGVAWGVMTSPAWSQVITGQFARLDLYTGIGKTISTSLNGGDLNVTVESKDSGGNWIARADLAKTISTYSTVNISYFYDDVLNADGSNATVFTALQSSFDDYRVTITPKSTALLDTGATNCEFRLNGYAIYDRDPGATPLPILSTTGNVIDFSAEGAENDLRNKVIVVGARKAAVTDSDKFNQHESLNNPMPEYFISVASNPYSIYDPTSSDYVGAQRVSVVVDSKVTDGDFAKWLARFVLFRFRKPKLAVTELRHTAIPVLEIRDAVRVSDQLNNSINHLVWVTEFTETWTTSEARVSIEASSYPELPSFTPREDVDISLFGNVPVTNLSAGYKNLYGVDVTNTDLNPTMIKPTSTTSSLVAATTDVLLAAHAIPETVYLYEEQQSGANTYYAPKINNPYQKFWHIARWESNAPRLVWDFQAGDGTAGVYDKAYYNFPNSSIVGSVNKSWSIAYEKMITRTGNNPFYDPYTSEVGNLVSIKFDALISGQYRVSLWSVNQKGQFEAPVAWLTTPTGTANQPDAHWSFMEAGPGKELTWDGVDNVGQYNRIQSQDTARVLEGSFGDKPIAVGGGYYAWNDKLTDLHTQIGDPITDNYGTDGYPYFTLGKYGQFFIRVEVKSDSLMRSKSTASPVEVNSHKKDLIGNANGSTNPFYIWTHLGEPSQASISIEEWNPTKNSAGEWSVYNYVNGWEKMSDNPSAHANALIRNGKPVRVKFSSLGRRGKLFENPDRTRNLKYISVQLTRQAHMKATIFDQFWTYFGKPWEGVHESNSAAKNQYNKEQKRLSSRMYHNEDHTIELAEETWRDGDQLAGFEWIFQPDQFTKDFGNGYEEAVRYGDYEQLETIPGFDVKRSGGAVRDDRSYLTYGYINYLFYMSAFVLDKSGRRQWCLNREFVDKSKIVTPTWLGLTYNSTWRDPAGLNQRQYATDYPHLGADTYLRRTMFVRQWTESTWKTGTYANSPVSKYIITDPHELKFVQPLITDFDPASGGLSDAAARAAKKDDWAECYQTLNREVNKDIMEHDALAKFSASYGPTVYTHNNYIVPGQFGTWGFDRGSYTQMYKPSPARDFHPYWTKAMPDWFKLETHSFNNPQNGHAVTGAVLPVYACVASLKLNDFRDIMAQDTWTGMAFGYGYPQYVADNKGGARVEWTVQGWADSSNKGDKMAWVFDYQRVDTLDRFDNFRGVFTRAPFQNRDKTTASFYDKDKGRISPVQPVKPSGTYLLNVGRYKDYIVGPMHLEARDAIIHYTEEVKDWFDIRFRNEYVWMNDRHFPVNYFGSGLEWRYREEYTGVSSKVQQSPGVYLDSVYYDAGAWTGWKDDRTSAEWTAEPFLRWKELFPPIQVAPGSRGIFGRPVYTSVINGENSVSGASGTGKPGPFLFGGYGVPTNGTPLATTGKVEGYYDVQGNSKRFLRANIFEDVYDVKLMRLAVGPQVPETSRLVMNLTLPERLKG